MATLQTTQEPVTPQAPKTTPFYDTVRERAVDDADFRATLLVIAVEAIVSGDLDESKAALRTYINSTTGYKYIADLVGVHPKSLIRMLGPEGNPRASTLASLLAQTLKLENIRIEVKANRKCKSA